MNYDVAVILGCWGLTQDSFTICGGVENVILTIGPSTPLYNEVMDYFDQMRLFDRPMFEWNAIIHVIHNLQEKFNNVMKPTWLPKQYERIQKYLQMHRGCGVYIKLALPENIELKNSHTSPSFQTLPHPTIVLPDAGPIIQNPARRTLKLVKR